MSVNGIYKLDDSISTLFYQIGVCATMGFVASTTIARSVPVYCAACCALQPVIARVIQLADKQFKLYKKPSFNQNTEWAFILLTPSMIAWMARFSPSFTFASLLQLSCIGALTIARDISLVR